MTTQEENAQPSGKDKKPHEFHIQIDRVQYTVTQETMTGAELRSLPEVAIGSDRDLFEILPGQPDQILENDTVVEIRDGKRFFTAPSQINPGQPL